MISKEKFVKILNRLKETNDLKDKINEMVRNSSEIELNDFTDLGSIMICFDDIVVGLLDNMFNTEMISYWVYELSYGEKYTLGCVSDKNGDIDISTPEKLYDYLITI